VTVGIVAAGAAARALEDLLFAFRSADATTAARARPLAEIGVTQSLQLGQLERAGVIKPGRDRATWYLDETALRTYRSKRLRWPMLAAGLAALLAALALAIGFLVSRR
jgi:hypothetical protein